MKYVLAIDQGTTGTRAILLSEVCEIISASYLEQQQLYPRPGWVEQNPNEIWENTKTVIKNVLGFAQNNGIDFQAIKAIGIANQGETVMLWDKKSGIPLYNAIVWQCRRTSAVVDELKKNSDLASLIKQKTGLIPDAYFSATKIKWIIEKVPEVRQKIKERQALAGTMDSWLIWKLTGGRSFFTDPSTASRTMLFNIHSLAWDEELLKLFHIPDQLLAEILPSSASFGVTKKELFGFEFPICASVVDQQAALFGQACFDEGMIKCTYGTGCFLLMNTGPSPVQTDNGLLTTIAWQIDRQTTYAIDGGVYIAGAAIQWLRDGLGIIQKVEATEMMAKTVPDSGGVFFVPAFSGLAAPYWDPFARGTIVGITGCTKKEHLVRATLEAIAYQVKNVFDAMQSLLKKPIQLLRADGGMTKNDFLMQFQSDILGISLEIPQIAESTALGAAFLAGLHAGVWSSLQEVQKLRKVKKIYQPTMAETLHANLINDWNHAVTRARGWENRDKK